MTSHVSSAWSDTWINITCWESKVSLGDRSGLLLLGDWSESPFHRWAVPVLMWKRNTAGCPPQRPPSRNPPMRNFARKWLGAVWCPPFARQPVRGAKELLDESEVWEWKSWLKDAQYHSLSDKCKSKPQWGTISHQSEWLLAKSLHTINAGECGKKGTLLHCWWECKLIQPLWRTVWRFL